MQASIVITPGVDYYQTPNNKQHYLPKINKGHDFMNNTTIEELRGLDEQEFWNRVLGFRRTKEETHIFYNGEYLIPDIEDGKPMIAPLTIERLIPIYLVNAIKEKALLHGIALSDRAAKVLVNKCEQDLNVHFENQIYKCIPWHLMDKEEAENLQKSQTNQITQQEKTVQNWLISKIENGQLEWK